MGKKHTAINKITALSLLRLNVYIVTLGVFLSLFYICCISPQTVACASELPSSQPTRERFIVDMVLGDKSQMQRAELPNLKSGQISAYESVSSGNTQHEKACATWGYLLSAEPPEKKLIRVTLVGTPTPLVWSVDKVDVLSLSASGNEAFLEFKQDGEVNISINSGDKLVFKLKARAVTGKKLWKVLITRVNNEGKTLDIYGKIID